MSVTIKQIAERTGLSIPTVGNVLGRASARYSEVTRRKVFAAVEEMGYRPNSSARAIRQGKIGCAALVLSRNRFQILSHLPAGLLDGVDQELSLHNMHLSVSLLSDEELSSDDFIPKVLREYLADGMLVNYTHEIPERMLELIRAHHTPAVWMNAKLSADCVHPDDRAAAYRATADLIRRGHRRIAFVHLNSPTVYSGKNFEQARPSFHFSVVDRLAGYSAAMKSAGLDPQICFNDRFVADEQVVRVSASLLTEPDRPTAIIAYSENEASPVLFAACKLGLAVPRDLTVLCFAPTDQRIAGILVPAIAVPTAELGRRAVRMLLRKIDSPNDPCECEAVPYEPLGAEAIAAPAATKSK
jgi:DNA-binding LacI/PurR family transcriptional regulator